MKLLNVPTWLGGALDAPITRSRCITRQPEPNTEQRAGGRTRTDDLRFTKPLLTGHAREVRPECPVRNRVIRVPKAPPGHRLTSTDGVSDPPYPPDPGLLDPPAASPVPGIAGPWVTSYFAVATERPGEHAPGRSSSISETGLWPGALATCASPRTDSARQPDRPTTGSRSSARSTCCPCSRRSWGR